MKKVLSLFFVLPMMLASCGRTGNDLSSSNDSGLSAKESLTLSTTEKTTYVINFNLDGGTSKSYQGPKTIESLSKDVFFFDCVKEGYNFRGWSYEGTKIFDEKGNQVAEPTLKSEMTFVAIYAKNVKLTIASNMLEAGEIKGAGEYDFNSYVEVSAHPYEKYRFVGWYFQETLLSENQNFKYMLWDKDVTIEARFAYQSFKMSVHSNNVNYGLVLIKDVSNPTDGYSSSYTMSCDYSSKVTVAAYSKTTVRFIGWYDQENNLVSANSVYEFVMPYSDYELEAKWNHFTITYNMNGGTNSDLNPKSYSIDDSFITLSNPATKAGYTFKGWKYNGQFITSIDPSWARNIVVEAIWEVNTYTITYHLDGGTNPSNNPSTYTVEKDVILYSATKNGYTFVGWYLHDESTGQDVYCSGIKKGNKVGDIELYAKWKATEYSITYNLNGGVNSKNNPLKYTIESEITLSSPTKDGYRFLGWYSNGAKVDNIEKGTTGNLVLEAKWSANLNVLTVTSEDTAKGTVSIVSGQGYSDEEITVKATPVINHAFAGWYDGTSLVSNDETYTFTMPKGDKTLVAHFLTAAEKEAHDKSIGKTPNYLSETNTLTYGLYPQTHVSDATLISTLNTLTTTESNGWYLYDGSYYVKKKASPYSSSYTFSDGTTIVSGTTYWFKCEPIVCSLDMGR